MQSTKPKMFIFIILLSRKKFTDVALGDGGANSSLTSAHVYHVTWT